MSTVAIMPSKPAGVMLACAALFIALLATLVPAAAATALTVPVPAHGNECFYVQVDDPGKKIQFYFAVQSGGSFDIDYVVSDPDFTVIVNGEKERQGDFVFAAEKKGEYSFCFSNAMSTFAEKVIDLDLSVEGEKEKRAKIPEAPTVSKDGIKIDTSGSEETLFRISTQLNSYLRSQKFYHTREKRSMATVASTETRVYRFATGLSLLMVLTSVAQVYVVKTFFRGYAGLGRI
ncbi:emp24/gp25L/p24 family/GOLD-domain-containing protein [Blastocladiella britannica]|nr:emp24/gp25L/p24 family/GOLD-domain-containing protein [Blastocladiella britannica]